MATRVAAIWPCMTGQQMAKNDGTTSVSDGSVIVPVEHGSLIIRSVMSARVAPRAPCTGGGEVPAEQVSDGSCGIVRMKEIPLQHTRF